MVSSAWSVVGVDDSLGIASSSRVSPAVVGDGRAREQGSRQTRRTAYCHYRQLVQLCARRCEMRTDWFSAYRPAATSLSPDTHWCVQERLCLCAEASSRLNLTLRLTHHRRRGMHAGCARLERSIQRRSDPHGRAAIAVLGWLLATTRGTGYRVIATSPKQSRLGRRVRRRMRS